MLSNAYFLAKFRFDTAENEPAKNCKTLPEHFAKFANFANAFAGVGLEQPPVPGRELRARSPKSRPTGPGLRGSKIGKITKFLQIFGGLVLGCIKTKFCKKICV